MRGRRGAAKLSNMPRITTDQVELNYDLTGSGETIVLVHGGWSDRNNWQSVAPYLARSFTVVAYDRRGHGLSQRGVQGTRRDQEDDLAALIEGLGGGPVNLVGTSFGASIAIGLTSRRPDLVRALIAHEPPLLSVVAGDPKVLLQLGPVQASIQSVLARVERGDPKGAARQFVEEVAFQPGAWEMLPQSLRETMVNSAPALVLEQRDAMWASVEPAALAGVEPPTVLTQGDESPAWFRSIVAALADTMGVAEVHTYRGAGHAPHVTHPSDFLSHVNDFLARTREPATVIRALA
jgi:pimeloyl-ACP methyl ester carboxylesterase